jgi:hypothetical protein
VALYDYDRDKVNDKCKGDTWDREGILEDGVPDVLT